MAGEGDARFEARMDRMEAMIRDIERRQTAVQTAQTAFKWASGIIAALVITVFAGLVGIDLARIFELGDKVAAVDKQTGQIATSMGHMEQDVSRMADDLEAVRGDVARVAVAVGAANPPKEQQKTELRR